MWVVLMGCVDYHLNCEYDVNMAVAVAVWPCGRVAVWPDSGEVHTSNCKRSLSKLV